MIDEVLGKVSAYAYAVEKGYTGTEEQFAYDLAHAADYASTAGTAAEEAAESEKNAKDSEEAAGQSETNAEDYAQNAHDDAAAALEAKGQAIAAKNDAVSAKGLAENYATIANNAKIAAVQSEQNASQSAESASDDAEAASNSASSASANSLKSEGFAVGEQNGVPVESGSPYYKNNAKYYCEEAAAQLGLVTAEGTRQIGLVTDEGIAQKAAVQEKGEQTLASIPEDYTTLRNDVSSLKSDLGIFKHQFSGEYDNNILFGAIWTFGEYIDYDGSTKKNANYAHTDMIEVEASTVYHALNCGGFFFNWYDVNQDRISGNSTNATSITSPDTAKYLIISLANTRWNGAKLCKETDYVIYGKEAYNSIPALDKSVDYNEKSLTLFKTQFSGEYDNNILFGVDWTFGGYVDYDGTIKSNANYAYTNMIEVEPSTLYHTLEVGGYFINYYDENEDRISGSSLINAAFTTPATAKYVIISLANTKCKKAKVYKESSYTIYGKEAYNLSGFVSRIFYIGSGQTYTTLKEGISEAVKYKNSIVYVLPGTYDLITEFASDISSSMGVTGIALKNGVHVIFCKGAKVTALFDNSNSDYDTATWRRIYDYFNPFHFAWSNAISLDFTLENLDIECSNTRYCVHDDYGYANGYMHKFTNCRMKYTNNHSDINYVQCIGGGCGIHGTIVIDGGYYESETDYGLTSVGGNAADSQQPISYHNTEYSNTAESTIIIKNVYLAGRGYFRFGWYGTSTIKSQVQISGCSTGLPTLVKAEGTATVNNFEVTEFCNEKRNAEHWVVASDGRTASLVND